MSIESGESCLRRMEEYVNKLNGQFSNEIYRYILHQTNHLLKPSQPIELRRKVWIFYIKIVRDHPDLLEHLRGHMLNLVKETNFCDGDISICIDFFIACTHNGRMLAYYESQFADLLVQFFEKMLDSPVSLRVKMLESKEQIKLLEFMTNLIKFNSAHLSNNESIKAMMITYVYHLAYKTISSQEMACVYEFLKSMTSYSFLPSESLNHFMITLCNGVNTKQNEDICYGIMRNVLGNYRSFSCVIALVHLIEDQTNYHQPMLLAGAINLVSKSLWGNLVNDSVCLSPNTALLAFLNVLTELKPNDHVTLAVAEAIFRFLLITVKTTPVEDKQLQIYCRMEDNKKKIIYDTILEATWESVINICSILFRIFTNSASSNLELKQMLRKIIDIFIYDLLEKAYSDIVCDNPTVCLNYKTSIKLVLSNVFLMDKLFSTIEMCFSFLEESNIEQLMKYRLFFIAQNYDSRRFERLETFFNIYFLSSSLAANVRTSCLNNLQRFLKDSVIDSDKFWEKVVSPHFASRSPSESRELAVNLLVLLALNSNSQKNMVQLIETLKKIVDSKMKLLSRHSKQHSLDTSQKPQILAHQLSEPITTEVMNNYDLIEALSGLVKIFIDKLDHPSYFPLSVKVFDCILSIATDYFYGQNDEDEQVMSIMHPQLALQAKLIIFDLILSMRINSLGQIGVLLSCGDIISPKSLSNASTPKDEYNVKYSPYLHVDFSLCIESNNSQQHLESSSEQAELSYAYQKALQLVLTCIRTDKQWLVLELIFSEMPKVLRHKGLIYNQLGMSNPPSPYSSTLQLNAEPTFADLLLRTLTDFITEVKNGKRTNKLKLYCDDKMSNVELMSHAYKSIISLVGHKLHSSNQATLIQHLLNGLVDFSSKPASLRQCIIALTYCAMEMQTSTNKQLNDIIKHLNQVCTNRIFAVPKLEFLSNVIIFPELCYTFTLKQYMESSMTAMLYVNPYRYPEFTVALALRAITIWFLKCPTKDRQQLINYVIQGLQGNILNESAPSKPVTRPNQTLAPICKERSKEYQPTSPLSAPHLHSTSRFKFPLQTSSSLEAPTCSATYEGFILDPSNMDNREISKSDLIEVCMDMFSTNVCTNTSPLPFKSSMVDKLLNKDKTAYWIVGNKIIQITTSGCSTRAVKSGFCAKCYTVCHMNELEKGNDNGHEDHKNTSPSKFVRLCEAQLKQNVGSSSDLNNSRRRHRSEIHSTQSSSSNASITSDDLFIHSAQRDDGSELSSNQYCKCWCQCWAEVLIRRATGNSRWTLKIENNLGEFPNWNYSKEEDESLANVFVHAHSEVGLRLKIKSLLVPNESAESDKQSSRVSSNESLKGTELDAGDKNHESSEVNGRDGFRDRSSTISIMSPAQKDKASSMKTPTPSGSRQSVAPSGLSPQLVFLQLYHSNSFLKKDMSFAGEDRPPILLFHPNDTTIKDKVLRSIKVFDNITPYETHKIGLLYAGPGQAADLAKMLANACGSLRYTKLMKGIGQLIELQNVDPNVCYLGGLNAGTDGRYAISWGDHLMQVIFHTATLMPRKDVKGVNKIVHIGNDFVVIVYNNSDERLDFSTVKGCGQVLQAMILVTPLPCDTNIVEVHAPQEFLDFIGHSDPQMISDQALPVYVRQLALHTNLAAMVSHKTKSLRSYSVWNWINRLHKIRSIRELVLKERKMQQSPPSYLARSNSMHSQVPLLAQRKRLNAQALKEEHEHSDSTSGCSLDTESSSKIVFPDFSSFG